MPKSQIIDPKTVRQGSVLKTPDIPVNQYSKTLADERGTFTDGELQGIMHDMRLIREFETMLNLVKTQGEYQGVEYDHKGPAHLSIGQEASAVGQAFLLDTNDHIFGSHRSHGEILAKGMSAIRKLSDDELLSIMKSFDDGVVLNVVEKGHQGSVRDLAIEFLVYGSLAEVFGRRNGFNQGLGGSMHAFFTPFGIYPNNALVGGSADIAAGAALYKRVNRKGGIVIANIGDASMGCGPVWEALNFAGMSQLRNLWDEAHSGGLPVLFNFMNNFYGMGGQTHGETMAFDMLARVGAGVNADAMHSERVDGYNPLAVIDAIRRKKAILEAGEGPVLMDLITYRFSGHSPSDASSYRGKEEVEAWEAVDPLTAYADELSNAGLHTADDAAALDERIVGIVKRAYEKAICMETSPRIPVQRIGELMFSNRTVKSYGDAEPDVLMPKEETHVFNN